MTNLAKHRTFFSIAVALIILTTALGAIFWARGFKPNFQKGKIDRTGLIVATSVPTGANVYLDGRLTSATNTNIAYLEPRTYKVRIEKDGYTTWEKDIQIREDLATEINALLFPLAPEIKPLTTTGSTNPTLSPDGARIAYAVSGERGGLFILPMDNSPFPFRQNTRLIAKNTSSFDFTKSRFIWNPDSKELIARFEDETGSASANLLIDSDKSDQDPRDITASLTATLASWQQTLDERAQTLALLAPDSVKGATTSAQSATPKPSLTPKAKTSSSLPTPKPINDNRSTINDLNYYPTGLIPSPDEEKLLYKQSFPADKQSFPADKQSFPADKQSFPADKQSFPADKNSEGKYKIYDLKLKREFTLPDFADLVNISWFPDSKHLVVAQKDIISIIESDGNNKMTIYTGKFVNGFVFAHPSGSRLIILTSLTQAENSLPNLYAINLK